MKFLITSGATREPIDRIRYITNLSTGRTGAGLADFFSQQGDEVTLLAGLSSYPSSPRVERIEYSSFQDLDLKMHRLLQTQEFDAVIHTAAVSDYSLEHPYAGKIDSSENELILRLKKNFKIIERIKTYSLNPNRITVVAFKLTDTPDIAARETAIHKLSFHPNIDWVIHNDLSEISESAMHCFTIYKMDHIEAKCPTKQDLALQLFHLLRGTRNDFNT